MKSIANTVKTDCHFAGNPREPNEIPPPGKRPEIKPPEEPVVRPEKFPEVTPGKEIPDLPPKSPPEIPDVNV